MAEEDDFINRFSEELHHASDFITVALNAHLEIERSLDGYINRIFEHTMYLDEAQLTFYQKVCITRAYAPTSHDRYEWGMMIFINTMRNKIAYRSRHKNLQFNVSQLRKTMRETSENLNAELASVSDKEVLVYAAAVCSGFLLILEEQLARHKGIEMDDCD